MSNELAESVERLFERAKHEALALIASVEPSKLSDGAESPPEWMTDAELARYWRIFNKDGEPVTAGIRSWAKREENPLPHAYMGDMLRFKRADADRWAGEEAERRRVEASRKRFRAAS